MGIAGLRLRRRRVVLLTASIGAALAALAAHPREARAACVVSTAGQVNCAADTVTTDTVNLDGTRSISSDREQAFDNGAAINAVIQSGVTVGGFGLELNEGSVTAAPVTVINQGMVTTARPFDALHIDGNGGLIRYSGSGGVTNTNPHDVALFVENVGGNVSIATGEGAITGATGMNASTTGAGAVRIGTGSGLVSGAAGPGIIASTANGPLDITIGSGGVNGVNRPGVEATSTNGDISVIANGNVSGFGLSANKAADIYGIEATSNGLGNIMVGGSGTDFGQYGRGIYAYESPTALGGIVVTGTGNTIGGSLTLGCPRIALGGCSGIRAAIGNPLDSSDILVNRSGNIISSTKPEAFATSGIHALTLGAGDITVATGADSILTNTNLFGVLAVAYGAGSIGAINVSTGARSTMSVDGVGIFAYNSAAAIPVSAGSAITVTNNGTINSGAGLNPINPFFLGGGTGTPTALPAGILAGYNGVPVVGPNSGPYTSCGRLGCVTLTPDPNVNGAVSVVNNGAINAAGGNGIFAYNFGNGDVSVASNGPIAVSGVSSRNGIEAFSAEVGALSVATTADVTALHGNGVYTDSVGRGATTIDVIAGVVEGGTSGVTAHARDGAMSITNSGTIQNVSGQPGDLAVRTLGSGGKLTNDPDGVITGLVSMTGVRINVFANAGVWNTLGASTFVGSGGVDNAGVLNALGATTLLGPTSLTNSGLVSLGGAGSSGGYPTLTTRSYIGAGGVLAVNAVLGADNSPSGRLVIDGGSATGRTVLIVNNVGGAGALTLANGIEVVEAINGATTAASAFTLGARVAAGAYEYQLFDGGNSATGGDPADQNWYLRSDLRPEVPLDMAIPALASRFGLAMIGTYHDRVGEEGVLDSPPASSAAPGGNPPDDVIRQAGWGRLFGETGSFRPGAAGPDSVANGGSGYDFGLSGFQTGVDLYRRAYADRSQDSAGLYVGAGAATGSVNQATGGAAGDLSMNGYTLGGYWTHRGASGWYVDAVAQTTFYDNVSADSAAGQAFATDGWGFAASLEGGYPIALGHDLTIEPQAQAIFQRISLGGGQDAYGLIDFGDADPLYGRIGARLSRLWTLDNGSAIETWGRANLWRAFGGDASTTFATLSGADPVTFGTSLGGTWAQFGLGASSRITRNVAVFASADCDLAAGGARGHGYDGRVGVEIVW